MIFARSFDVPYPHAGAHSTMPAASFLRTAPPILVVNETSDEVVEAVLPNRQDITQQSKIRSTTNRKAASDPLLNKD